MKKLTVSVLSIVFISGILLAVSFSFKGYFPGIPYYESNVAEAPFDALKFQRAGVFYTQNKYVHEKRDNWCLVTYSIGNAVSSTSSLPLGFSMNRNGIIMRGIKMQGYNCFYSYYLREKKGTINVYFPQNRYQKYNGMVSFVFTNTAKAKADQFLKHFNFKKIHKRMKDLK